ncbi:MAG: NAD(P)/FAD-dependent oxidoreductase [Candidatus Limnocylindrales bacterium]
MTVDVVIVGGGPAGAAVASHLARAGREVVLLERAPAYRWHAGGVFTSPAAVSALRRLGLTDDLLHVIARPVPAMRVETRSGVTFRMTYGDDGSLSAPAVGLDRAVLDPILLDLASRAGAAVRMGVTVTRVERPARGGMPFQLDLRSPSGGVWHEAARVVVGADGIRSQVARSLGVGRPARLGARIGLTFHLADPGSDGPRDARMRVLRDGYIGIAPVPRGRVNVGIVLGRSWRPMLFAEGAQRLAARIVRAVPRTDDDPATWRTGDRCDAVVGAAPIGHRVTRPAGSRWFLVGDAAGFLDPFTGEGLHRALVSAELAADAIEGLLAGRRGAPAAYLRAMHARFRAKDRVSWLVQAFLSQPALFDYAARRLARRPGPRETLGLVMGDLVPAERALDPRFLAALLAP